MIKQLSFGFDEPPVETDPLFLAIVPDEETAQRFEQCAEQLRKTYGLTGASRPFHITLCEIVPRTSVPKMLEALAGAGASMTAPPFSVVLDHAVKFGKGKGEGAVVLTGNDGVAGLIAFRQALCFALQKAGLGKWSMKGYTPHLTVLYDTRELDARIEPVEWTVREFVLLRSLVGQAKHVPLGRWALGG
jgi:2'-5' RNA ligase